MVRRDNELKLEKYIQNIVKGISQLEETLSRELPRIRDAIYLNTLATLDLTIYVRELGKLVESFRISGFGIGFGIGFLVYEGGPKLPYR